MSLLSVSEGRGRKEEITGEAKTWLISITCMKPKDLGYAAEIWTTSALTKQMLRGIRVSTKLELEERIYKYFDEINEEPVVYHWGWNLEGVDSDEAVKVQTLVS